MSLWDRDWYVDKQLELHGLSGGKKEVPRKPALSSYIRPRSFSYWPLLRLILAVFTVSALGVLALRWLLVR